MDFVPQSVRWLIPEETVPCDIYLHFRGQNAVALPCGQTVSFKLLEKLAKMQSSSVYVHKNDLPAWEAWKNGRCPGGSEPFSPAEGKGDADPAQRYGNKRAELLSYVQRSLGKKSEEPELGASLEKAALLLQKVIRLPSLDWYFQQFHEPPDLFFHNGRVAYALTIFCLMHSLASERELETLIYSALIHEVEGDPSQSLKTVASQQTLAFLEKKKHPVPKEVIEFIRLHDELCSGKGFPDNKKMAEIPRPVRAFTLFNHFDHYRLQCTGTRRARLDRTKLLMEARAADYDGDLLPLLWRFWTQQFEAIT